jgi:thioredoxin-dependent peroxiredoxin
MKLLRYLALLLTIASGPSEAALDLGEVAPDFTAAAALGGQEFEFSLRNELKKGPVVLYFFPAAMDQFKSLGASVIGVSRDEIDAQKRFSVAACRGKFAVAADPDQRIMKAYDAVLTLRPEYANRVTYIIAPNGTIAYQYTSLNPDRHVQKTLAALRDGVANLPPSK